MNIIRIIPLSRYLSLLSLIFTLSSCSLMSPDGGGSRSDAPVVLDIGHYLNGSRGTGAMSPVMRDGSRLEETVFWYKYSRHVKKVVTRAGYNCIVINRGCAPTSPELIPVAKSTPIIQLNHPDTRGINGRPARYPSHYHPENIAAGMISADYAIWRNASCVVFLHQDSSSNGWQRAYKSSVFHNVRNGRPLAHSIASSLNTRVLGDTQGKMPNHGHLCTTQSRSNPDLGGAAWLNTCDSSHIPAVVVEGSMLNNPDHAYWLAQEKNAIQFAQAIGEGIVAYLQANKKVGSR
ncbi:MAG: N-acetylmuramoyl-L-alanine amidase [Akkermansia sp.]